MEIELRGRVVGGLWASAAATLLETEVVNPGVDQTTLFVAGQSLIRRPDRKIAGELSYRAEKLPTLSLRVQAVGKRDDRDFGNYPSTPVVLDAYTRVDLGADYGLPRIGSVPTRLTLRVENLTDVEYQNVFNFLAPRRTIVGGVRATF